MKSKLAIGLGLMLLTACDLEPASVSPNSPGGGNENDPTYYFIDVPGIASQDVVNGDEYNFRVTNSGLFLHVFNNNDESKVFRYEDGSSSSYLKWKSDDFFFNIQPSSMDYDKREQLSFFFHNLDKHGFIGVNTSTPAEIVSPNPTSAFNMHENLMLCDFSLHPSKWIFYSNSTVAYIKWDNTNTVQNIINLPQGYNTVEPDNEDAIMFLGVGSELQRLTLSGDLKKISVPSNPNVQFPSIQKIRVVDETVYFLAGDKVYSVDRSLNNLKELHTISGIGILYDFAVDGSSIYTSDGMKTPVTGGQSTEIFSNASSTDIDYITARSATMTGAAMETHKGAGYVYYLTGQRVLAVKK